METNSTILVWLLIIASIIVIALAGYGIYKYLQGTKEPRKNSLVNENAMKNVLSGLIQIMEYFSGNLNVLRDISKEPNMSMIRVAFDSIHQIIDVKGNDEVKKWYSDFEKDRSSWDMVLYKNKAKELIDIFMKCGIRQHEEKDVVWNKEASKKYNRLSPIEEGQECTVVAPYWIYNNGEIFEKGFVKEK